MRVKSAYARWAPPIASLRHAIRELRDYTDPLTTAHGDAGVKRRFTENRPLGGPAEPVYDLLRHSAVTRLAVGDELVDTFFEDIDAAPLLIDVGLARRTPPNRPAVPAPRRRSGFLDRRPGVPTTLGWAVGKVQEAGVAAGSPLGLGGARDAKGLVAGRTAGDRLALRAAQHRTTAWACSPPGPPIRRRRPSRPPSAGCRTVPRAGKPPGRELHTGRFNGAPAGPAGSRPGLFSWTERPRGAWKNTTEGRR
ncbi:hypothetical protein ACWD0Z_30960 [Streptomyces sp. NPDC003007]